jgi:hypothetical protein
MSTKESTLFGIFEQKNHSNDEKHLASDEHHQVCKNL